MVHTTLMDIKTIKMHERCGEKINFRYESIFTVKIEFVSSAIIPRKETTTKDVNTYHGKDDIGICDIYIESWDFQNHLMLQFEELNFGPAGHLSESYLEIADGPSGHGNSLAGLPRMVYSRHAGKAISGSYVASDKHVTIRYHRNGSIHDSIELLATVVAFKDGPCRSYEFECWNAHCIMRDLVCNGHNPCGDHSDCLTTRQPAGVAAADNVVANDNVLLAVVVAGVPTAIVLVVGVLVICRYYVINDKRPRLAHQHEYLGVDSTPQPTSNREDTPQACNERTSSQIDAERRFSPPSYSTLPALQQISVPESCSDNNSTLSQDCVSAECFDHDETKPPSYACVLLHREDYHVSKTSLPESLGLWVSQYRE
ncbi:hypothetical protein DPMN_176465 [Dreissena polymorpha]|uniref:CUB domain-containing protein n=1 Tax=Dreissena polymorpha TaxID=45954 RepID=A0A9D4IJ81_DREPO|nr:hypothetical protein DPMN_176465 [Dreissena polymorpha]